MKRHVALATVALLSVASLVACGDAGDSSEGSSAPTGAIRKGGVLTIGAAQGINKINPVTKDNAWQQVLFPLMWNGLVKTGPDEKIEADLATAWKPDAAQRVWTFDLRPGVKFSNGKTLSPADVVATIRYYQAPDTATQLKNAVAPISKVEAAGSSVVFTLAAPNALFPASIQNVKIVDTASLSSIESTPAVTGPFKVKEYVPNDRLTLERNPDYFGEAPPLDGVKIVKAADSSSAVTALQSGDLDALWSVPLSQVAAIGKNPRLSVVKPKVIGQYVSWEVDTTSPPFDNPKARQALAYAIDQKAILQAAYFGQGVVSTTNNPLPSNHPEYGGTLTDYSYDLDKAKQLFAEAGITEGSTLTWWGVAGQYPEWNTSGQILQASLKKIGINLKIENTEIASWSQKFYPAGKKFPGLVVPNFQSFPSDPANEFSFLLKGRCECNWNDPRFGQLYDQALATADESARKAVWGQVQELVNQQVPIYVPVQFATLTATKSTVSGLWVDGAGNPHLENAGFTG